MGTEGNSLTSKEAQNNFRRQAIRDLYYIEMKSGYLPTINDLNPKVNNILGQQIQPFALVEVYKSLGFEYALNSSTNTSELIETAERRLKRIKYLKSIRHARRTGCRIVYTLITGTIVGGVSIIVLVAAVEGMVFKESVCVESAETFSPETAKDWVQKNIINHIPNNSIIVLSESSFERFVSDMPNYSSTPKSMKAWLDKHDIPFGKDYTKPELYEVIKLHKENFFYREFCFKTILIPDDNPGFNPLDIVWYNMEPYDYKTLSDIRLKEFTKAVTIVGMLRKLKLGLSISNLNKAISALFGSMLEKIWQSCMNKVLKYEEKIMNTERNADELENNDCSASPSKMETEPVDVGSEMHTTKNDNIIAKTVRGGLQNFTCDDDDEDDDDDIFGPGF